MNIEQYKQIANNILIAEFMQLEQNDGCFLYDAQIGTEYFTAECLEYNDNWNWLMDVVEKIEQNELIDIDILQYGTIIRTEHKDIVNNVADTSFNNKIEHTYDAVIKYIKQISYDKSIR